MLTAKRRSGKSVAISTAEAFYRVFCALPKKDRLTVARFIFDNDDIRHEFDEIPNETTIAAFEEDKSAMQVFHSIEELKKDLLA